LVHWHLVCWEVGNTPPLDMVVAGTAVADTAAVEVDFLARQVL